MTPKPVKKSGPNKPDIIRALKTVIDPELHINIVDLGLIYGVSISGSSVAVTLTLTSPGCILAGTIHKLIETAVKKVSGVEQIKLDLAWDPPWTPDRISPKYQAEFGL